MAFDDHLALGVDFGPRRVFGVQRLQEGRGALVDEALHQGFVQLVRQAFFQVARGVAPMIDALQPAAAVGDIGQGAHARQARRQGVDIALGLVQAPYLGLEPVFGDRAVGRQPRPEQVRHQLQVLVQADLAEVRQLAGFPQDTQ